MIEQKSPLFEIPVAVIEKEICTYLREFDKLRLCLSSKYSFMILHRTIINEEHLSEDLDSKNFTYQYDPNLFQSLIKDPYHVMKKPKLFILEYVHSHLLRGKGNKYPYEKESVDEFLQLYQSKSSEFHTDFHVFLECCRHGLIREVRYLYKKEYKFQGDFQCLRASCFFNRREVVKFLCAEKGGFIPGYMKSQSGIGKKSKSPAIICINQENVYLLDVLFRNIGNKRKGEEKIREQCYWFLRIAIRAQAELSILFFLYFLTQGGLVKGGDEYFESQVKSFLSGEVHEAKAVCKKEWMWSGDHLNSIEIVMKGKRGSDEMTLNCKCVAEKKARQYYGFNPDVTYQDGESSVEIQCERYKDYFHFLKSNGHVVRKK